MNSDVSIEEDLRHMLAAAGGDTAVPTDLMDQVKRGYGRRRSLRLATLSGAAVLVLSAGIGLMAHPGGPAGKNPSTVATRPTPSPTHVQYSFRETNWAANAFRMPANLDGHPFYLVGMLDSRHVLVATLDGFEHMSTLSSYDIDTQATSVLTDLTVTGGLTKGYPLEFFLDDHVVVWWTIATASGGAAMVQFWAFDRTTGAKHVVATLPDTQVMDISVVDDEFFFSDSVGVHRVALGGGGTAELVAGSVPRSILDGVWAYSVLTPGGVAAKGGANVRPTGTLLNMLTGERRTVTGPAGAGTFYCTAAWCVGHLLRDNVSAVFAMRADGSDLAVFPATVATVDGFEPLPIGGHYQLFNYPNDRDPVVGLLDLASGENGGLAVWVQHADGSWGAGPSDAPTPSMSDSRETGATSRATPAGPAVKEMVAVCANPAIVGWPTPSGDEIYVLPLS